MQRVCATTLPVLKNINIKFKYLLWWGDRNGKIF